MRVKAEVAAGTIVVAGALANKPRNGGAAWTRLSWLLGFQKLGFPVFFLEEIQPEVCTDALGRPAPFERSENRRFFWDTLREFGLDSHASLICGDGRWEGVSLEEAEAVCESARLLVNISGHLRIERLLSRIARRVYLDLDPGFTQIWAEQGERLGLRRHHLHYTVGANIGSPDCTIPTVGLSWRTIRQPVLLDGWPELPPNPHGPLSTVASWRGPYGPVRHGRKNFGVKAHQFRRFIELPRRAEGRFELALDIHPADRQDRAALVEAGWTLVDPRTAAGDPASFRRFVQSARGEFSVAQSVYVETNSGWFSDRTTRYLASGRPALVQETGFSREIPVGTGLLTFRSLDEAVRGVAEIGRDYPVHCRAARRLAEEFFDSDRVLGRFVKECLDEGPSESRILLP